MNFPFLFPFNFRLKLMILLLFFRSRDKFKLRFAEYKLTILCPATLDAVLGFYEKMKEFHR